MRPRQNLEKAVGEGGQDVERPPFVCRRQMCLQNVLFSAGTRVLGVAGRLHVELVLLELAGPGRSWVKTRQHAAGRGRRT